MNNAPLTLDDIADARAYERERDVFRSRIIELKKLRRIGIGPVVTLVFENRETIRFQIQEMARAEKLFTDEAIQGELDAYNPLIPAGGRLMATLFIELTSRPEMEHWLPRLVGVERAVRLVIGSGPEAEIVPAQADPSHAAALTRDEITSAVHYVGFSLNSAQIARFPHGPVGLAVDHPNYRGETTLSEPSRASLFEDLLG